MAEGTTLDTDDLAVVTWEIADTLSGAPALVASPQDAKSRGMALAITRTAQPLDLSATSFHLYLAWRHLQTHARGLMPFETIDASKGSFRIFWPAAMAADEGSAECEIVLSWNKRTLSSPAFEVSVGTALLGMVSTEDGFTLFADVIKKYEKATTDALGIATELAAAKDAGEFDGRDGVDGKDGTPGAKGEKGDIGPAGPKGADGTSCTHSWSGSVLTITSASGTSSADLIGPKGDKGSAGEDGSPGAKGEKGDTGPAGPKGADGTSCTHSWSGTILTITSASGTSSADLRGPKGDTGPAGKDGETQDLSAYATQEWVTQKIPDLSSYATKAWVAEQFPDLSGVSY